MIREDLDHCLLVKTEKRTLSEAYVWAALEAGKDKVRNLSLSFVNTAWPIPWLNLAQGDMCHFFNPPSSEMKCICVVVSYST